MVPSDCTAHKSSRNHRVSCWEYLLWLQICKYANRQRGQEAKSAEPQGQSHKGAALSSPFLYTSRKVKDRERARGQWRDGQRAVTDESPSAVLCHRPGLAWMSKTGW